MVHIRKLDYCSIDIIHYNNLRAHESFGKKWKCSELLLRNMIMFWVRYKLPDIGSLVIYKNSLQNGTEQSKNKVQFKPNMKFSL